MIQEIKNQIKISYFKSNLSFFISAICFSILIFYPEKLWIVFSALVIIIAGFLSIVIDSVFSKIRRSHLLLKSFAIFSAILSAYLCARRFFDQWLTSKAIIRMALKLNLTNIVIVLFAASVLALIGLWFLYVVFILIFEELRKLITENILVSEPKSIIINLKSNAILILSACAFMGLNTVFNTNGIIALFVSYLLIVFLFSQYTNILKTVKAYSRIIKIISFVSTIGICYYARLTFLSNCRQLYYQPRIVFMIIPWLSVVVALFSCITVFVFVSFLLNYVVNKLKTTVHSLSKVEIAVYSLIIVSLVFFVCNTFIKSNAFWGTDIKYDIIYTSDSSNLVKRNVYLRLYHAENDLRQPLFAVFAAPFVGLGYTFSIPFTHISEVFAPLFMNNVQVMMIVVANIMLAKMLNLTSIGRICFVLISTVTYTTLLFSIMMEQYIIAYFWLIFVIFSYVENKRASEIMLSAAGGTLLTSLILVPTSYSANENSIRKFVSSVEKSIFVFLIMLFAFGRLDVLLNFSEKTKQLSGFAGGESISGRIKQYFSFVSSCFIAPNAVVDTRTYDHVSWQLSKSVIMQINIVGVVIIALCSISFIVNRRNMLTKISAMWVCFSVLLLCIVGWGSAENGMILYSLYFGWAFLVLLFQLLDWISKRINFKALIPIISIVLITVLGVFNYLGIKDMLRFAFTYYPFQW